MAKRKTALNMMSVIILALGAALARPVFGLAGELDRIRLTKDPCSVLITLTEKAPYKVVRFDERQILVAFKDVDISGGLPRKGYSSGCVRDVNVVRTPKGVISIVITMENDVASVSSAWKDGGLTLAIQPVFADVKSPKETTAKAKKEKERPKKIHEAKKEPSASEPHKVKSLRNHLENEPKADVEENHSPAIHGGYGKTGGEDQGTLHKEPPPPHGPESYAGKALEYRKGKSSEHKAEEDGSHAPEHEKAKAPGMSGKEGGEPKAPREKVSLSKEDYSKGKELFQGLKNRGSTRLKTSDDLYLEIEPQGCENETEIQNARKWMEKEKWADAFEVFDRYAADKRLAKPCLEYVTLMKAHTYFKDLEKSEAEWKDFLRAADHFNDMISYFPDSLYVPYALTSLGKIYLLMKDHNLAEGYFQIVKNNYKEKYPGIPEIMFELGWIYTEKNDTQLAIEILKDVVARFPDGSFIGKAKLKLGKAYFNTSDFNAAIRIFEELIKEKPQMVYDSSELLLYLGNAYYQTGNKEKAMSNLLKVYNLYPEMEGRDTLLTRIGDILIETGHKDQAVKIFKAVTKKFPQTDGFVISTMRLAEYLEDPKEKEKMYTMVINDFPGNPLGQLAMLRLALLQNKAKEYDKSIDTIKVLIAMRPRDLMKDAVALLQDSSGYMFNKLLSEDQTTELISRYETDMKYLDDTEKPDVFFCVGMAYLKTHLYENAVNTLSKAYNRMNERQRTKELIYAIGTAMDEAGRGDEAIDMLEKYLKKFPQGPDAAAACSRIGHIYMERRQHTKAIAMFNKAYERTRESKKRAPILMDIADNYKELGEYGKAVSVLENASALLSTDSEGNAELLIQVYKRLAENQMKLGRWAKSSDVLVKAMNLSPEPKDMNQIQFMLGETYHSMRKDTEAEASYSFVVDNGDDFWSGMARERLRELKLKGKLDKNQ